MVLSSACDLVTIANKLFWAIMMITSMIWQLYRCFMKQRRIWCLSTLHLHLPQIRNFQPKEKYVMCEILRLSYKLAFLRWNCLVWPLTEIITACISTSISHYASRQIFEQRYGNILLNIYLYVFITADSRYEIIP